MNVDTKVKFSRSLTQKQARDYIEQTLNDASGMRINITWGFDEAQADAFHRGWDGERFLQCIEKIM